MMTGLSDFADPVELHPDLKRFLFRMDNGWTVLQHPLVYRVPYHGDQYEAAQANSMYEFKRKAMEEAIATNDFNRMVAMYERPWRIEVIKRYRKKIPADKYPEIVRDVWTDSENIYQNFGLWRMILKPFIGKDVFQTLSALPDEFTVYRGGSPDGFSWTLKKETAEWFSRRFRSEDDHLPVWEITIPKSKAIAYFTDRSEEEILWIPKQVDIDRMNHINLI
jgi:hypothetical protein